MCLTKVVPTSELSIVKGYKVFLKTDQGLSFDTQPNGRYLTPGVWYQDTKTRKIRTTAVDHDNSVYSGWSYQEYLVGYHFFLLKKDAIFYANNKAATVSWNGLPLFSDVFEIWECSFKNITGVGAQEVQPYWFPGTAFPKPQEVPAAVGRRMRLNQAIALGDVKAVLAPPISDIG